MICILLPFSDVHESEMALKLVVLAKIVRETSQSLQTVPEIAAEISEGRVLPLLPSP
jgi:hypothetical protein